MNILIRQPDSIWLHFEGEKSKEKHMMNAERSFMTLLFSLYETLTEDDKNIMKRLAEIDEGTERWKKLLEDVTQLIIDLMKTATFSDKRAILNVISNSCYTIKPKSVTQNPNNIMYVTQQTMKTLVKYAMKNQCRTCIIGMDGVTDHRNCDLFRIMDDNIPVEEEYTGFGCPYAQLDYSDL